MKYREALLQTRRMGCFCKWCNADVPMSAIAERLGTVAPWLADLRYRRAWTRWVASHLRKCAGDAESPFPGKKRGRPMDVSTIREQVGLAKETTR